ncbi:hypothetical protein JJJ17_02745 [Paracoccus caeni]|uniref:Uncharacterized protein n=1 Tax=Paracoccus caeni TaxID=657651 RepID=A0A934SBT5_9RHOB|nr:hypothetical protein [Paracoccus caeni]MBK4214838.1 hypothetical protein [Paracoccus caeni]
MAATSPGSAENHGTEDGLGRCDRDRANEYFRYRLEIGGVGVGQVPAFLDPAQRQSLRAAFSQLELPDDRTTFVVAHDPSLDFYTGSCGALPCTMEEVAEPEQACLREHWDNCYYVATRHAGETFCLLNETE